ncbi:hypothetical protein [Hamadaea tsunoensis]|uniref:hypothetical protein n=1 Tax=Hamadaea tsunoensis TaxID=53368 RepID=UPI0003FD7678|nr:hypothetical protein [Hamadaea tsunoensis]
MQVRKVGAVAVGALATVAAFGAPAAAAPYGPPVSHDDGAVRTATDATPAAGVQRSAPAGPADLGSTLGGALGLGLDKDAPAKIGGSGFQPLISIGAGSSVMAAPWQVCGSTAVAGVGGAASQGTPNTVIGDCSNSHVQLKQDGVPGLISILDDSDVDALPWQVCGSNVVAGVGATVASSSPATVTGDCTNAQTHITGGADATGPKSLISVLSGSAVHALPWQVCGSTAVMGLGVAAGLNSPTTVIGGCDNSRISITKRANPAVIPLLSNVGLNVLPLQACASDSLFSLVGLSPAIDSPANVLGGCDAGGVTYE